MDTSCIETGQVLPYGSWPSPLSAQALASGSVRLGQILMDENSCVYWAEGRPQEGGRVTIVRSAVGEAPLSVLPEPYSCRSLVHEYGGGAFLPVSGLIYFVNHADQRLYSLDTNAAVSVSGAGPKPITRAGDWRYADFCLDSQRNRLICVCETIDANREEPLNQIVAICLDGEEGEAIPEVLVSGADFYAYPRLSPCGNMLSYIAWNHPNMPWDSSYLHLQLLEETNLSGQENNLPNNVVVAGSGESSIFQPIWSRTGKLFYVSDQSGFWNIYVLENAESALRERSQPDCRITVSKEAEFGLPLWVFGMSTYAVLDDELILCAFVEKGIWSLALLQSSEGEFELRKLESGYTDISYVCARGNRAAVLASSPQEPASVLSIALPRNRRDLSSNVEIRVLKRSFEMDLDPLFIPAPEPIEFESDDGSIAYAFYYPPASLTHKGPDCELPPLLVKSHGGPTGATTCTLKLDFIYWTSRGFGVVDVNYGGSTGYGVEYRKRLDRAWGLVDVQDCQSAARYLVAAGRVDSKRLAITGGSAGGYTTLCALTFGELFSAGASHYGIGDLEALARETHKFESRYCDRLIGRYPEEKDIYRQRSPLFHTDRLSCPVIFLQGLEDKVVPPGQAESMVEALKNKGVPVAYLAFPGEQHGFRKAVNISRAYEAEYYFYCRVFGIEPADSIEPVEIYTKDEPGDN